MKIEEVKYFTAILNIAAENGFEFDTADTIEEVQVNAENYILENEPCGSEFVECELSTSGYNQSYSFVDECGMSRVCSGDIFDFSHHYSKDSDILFRKDNDHFEAVAWFDLPDGGEERENYIFVYDKVVMSNGKVALLYDHFKA